MGLFICFSLPSDNAETAEETLVVIRLITNPNSLSGDSAYETCLSLPALFLGPPSSAYIWRLPSVVRTGSSFPSKAFADGNAPHHRIHDRLRCQRRCGGDMQGRDERGSAWSSGYRHHPPGDTL